MLGGIRNGWAKRGVYEWFEHGALVSLMFVISLITLFAFCVTITQLFADAGGAARLLWTGWFCRTPSVQF
jgi:hypothetical protein